MEDCCRLSNGDLPISRSAAGQRHIAAANYRAVCRAHTRPTFIAKLSIVVEEADETLGWLETLERARVVTAEEIAPYKKEANELVAIFVASRRTASGHR